MWGKHDCVSAFVLHNNTLHLQHFPTHSRFSHAQDIVSNRESDTNVDVGNFGLHSSLLKQRLYFGSVELTSSRHSRCVSQ